MRHSHTDTLHTASQSFRNVFQKKREVKFTKRDDLKNNNIYNKSAHTEEREFIKNKFVVRERGE